VAALLIDTPGGCRRGPCRLGVEGRLSGPFPPARLSWQETDQTLRSSERDLTSKWVLATPEPLLPALNGWPATEPASGRLDSGRNQGACLILTGPDISPLTAAVGSGPGWGPRSGPEISRSADQPDNFVIICLNLARH
jgi:hypothetical protein